MLTGVFRGACLCSHSPMFPQPYVPTALCSHSPMFPQPNVPTFLRAFSKLGLSLCSHISNTHYKISAYVPTVHLTLTLTLTLTYNPNPRAGLRFFLQHEHANRLYNCGGIDHLL